MVENEPENLDTPAMKAARAEDWEEIAMPNPPLDQYAERMEELYNDAVTALNSESSEPTQGVDSNV